MCRPTLSFCWASLGLVFAPLFLPCLVAYFLADTEGPQQVLDHAKCGHRRAEEHMKAKFPAGHLEVLQGCRCPRVHRAYFWDAGGEAVALNQNPGSGLQKTSGFFFFFQNLGMGKILQTTLPVGWGNPWDRDLKSQSVFGCFKSQHELKLSEEVVSLKRRCGRRCCKLCAGGLS